jgi:hypothetical protein
MKRSEENLRNLCDAVKLNNIYILEFQRERYKAYSKT